MHPELGPTWPGGQCHGAAVSQVLMAEGCILMEVGMLFPPEFKLIGLWVHQSAYPCFMLCLIQFAVLTADIISTDASAADHGLVVIHAACHE